MIISWGNVSKSCCPNEWFQQITIKNKISFSFMLSHVIHNNQTVHYIKHQFHYVTFNVALPYNDILYICIIHYTGNIFNEWMNTHKGSMWLNGKNNFYIKTKAFFFLHSIHNDIKPRNVSHPRAQKAVTREYLPF